VEARRTRRQGLSYVELRLLPWICAGALLLAVAVPLAVWATDFNGDNLDDAWEAQYGISTNAYDATNLVGWWQLNGTNNTDLAIDRSGNGINGTLSGFPTVAYGPGLFSNALYLTNNSSVTFPTTNSVLNLSNGFTYSAWVLATNSPSQAATLATWKAGTTNAWSVGATTNGVATVTFYDGATAQVVQGGNSPVNLYDGTWHQVAATLDTNQLATIYVDGQAEATNSITGWSPGSASSFTFGPTDTNSVTAPVALDEVRLYDRALGAQEVTQLPVTYSDLNGSGLSVFDDFLENLNPLATNSIVSSAFIDSGLADYYGTSLPVLTASSGDSQTVSSNAFAENPLVVHVADGSGNPLSGAPVTFSIPAGSDGGVAQTSGGSVTPSLSITTDASGNATAYYQAGPDALQNNTITATAVAGSGSVAVSFTARCGVQDGLVTWLDADAGVTADGSGNVSQWSDQSPNGNSASQNTPGIQPTWTNNSINGHSVIHFDGSSTYLGMPRSVQDDFTMVVVLRSNMGTGSDGQWYGAGGIVDGETPGAVNDFGMSLDPSGEVLTGVGNPDTTATSMTGGYNNGRGHIATFFRTESTGAFSQYVDSVFQNSQSGNTGTLDSPPQLTIGATQTLANYFGGDVAEILLYNRNLSTTEQQQIEGFLADKYDLYSTNATWPLAYSSDVQAQITANQWTKAEADAYVAFVSSSPPVPAAGLLLWLKADSGVAADGGNNVLQWTDQSPSGHILSQTSQSGVPVLQNDSNGQPTIRFNGGQALYMPDYLPANDDVTIISVASIDSPNNFQTELMLGSPDNDATRGLGDFYGSANFDIFGNGATGGTVANAGEKAITTVTYSRGSGAVNFYLRGSYDGYGNVSVSDLTSGFVVGNNANFGAPWTGNVSEILVYNHVLGDSERAQAEGTLADHYGVYDPAATWPLSYSADVQELITENDWNQAEADAYVASLNGAVAAPTLSPVPGRYSSAQTVTVNSATSDATIYYTTDGSTPTTSSSSITNGGQLTVSSSTQYQFLAADATAPNSPVTSALYSIGNVGSLVAGDSFTMVLKPDGTVWSWGDDGRGQEADNQANNPAPLPQQITSLTGATSIAAAGDHALAVVGGSVMAWGADDQSQGGDGGTTDLYVPTAISSLSNIVSVWAGQVNGFAIDNSGNLYGWGNNDNGQLGDGTNNNQSTPEAITSVTGVIKVVSNPNFTVVLKSDGTVWAAGSNNNGALGDGTYNSENYFQQIPNLADVTDIAAGFGHVLALRANGTVWAWGYDWDGELGNGNFNPGTNFPQQVLGLPLAVAVEAVDSKSFVILADGTIRSFGGNGQGNLGLGAGNDQAQATPVQPPGIANVTLLAAGTFHTVICTDTGALYGWGDNTSYRLTQDFAGSNFNINSEAHDPSWQGFIGVACAGNSSIALKNDGTVWTVGEGDYGGLGNGNWYNSESPVQTTGLSGVTKVAGANGESYALDNNGNLWGWGGNWSGQLGFGNYNTTNSPTQVQNVQNVTAVAVGDNHMLAVESNGTVWAVGDDAQGELGDATTNNETIPIQVSPFSSATEAAAGANTSFVLQSDGTVWAWGQNDSGQLGFGYTGNVASPTQITSLPTMVAISAQSNNAMGIDSSGNVWTWGSNGNGDGTPLEQSGLTNVTAIAAGVYHNLAIKNDGSVWGLGAGWLGQLGNNSYNNDNNFTPLSGIQGAISIAAGYGDSLIVKQDGTVSGFGSCNNGELAGGLGIYAVVPKPLFGIAMSETPPTVSFTQPVSGATGQENTAIDLQASATASTGVISRVDYYLNGVKVGSSTSGGSWDYSWTPTTYGNLTMEAVAYDSAGRASVSAPVTLSVAPNIPPTAPTNVTVTSGPPGTVYLGWTNGSGASTILIQEQAPDGSWFTLATLTDPTISSYVISGLTTGQGYAFRVVEQNGSGTTSGLVSDPSGTNNPPTLSKVGDNQTVAPSTFASAPLLLQISDASGHPLSNVPVSFALSSGSDGGIALTNGGSVANTQNVMTNASGQATIFYQSGADVLQNNTINASVPSGTESISTAFTAHCGVQNGLGLWLRADAGVTADANGNISTWADQSAAHEDAVQNTSGNQPQTIAGSINGQPVVRFDGSSEYLQMPPGFYQMSAGATVFTVFTPTNLGSYQRIFDLGNGTPQDNVIFSRSSNNSTFTFESITGNAPPYDTVQGSSESQLNTSQEYTGILSGSTSMSLFQNGSLLDQVTSGLTAPNDVTRNSNYIGKSNWSGDSLFQGDMAEVLVYNRPLSTTEQDEVEGYLADKYGLYSPNATWLLAYSSDVQAQITSNQWNQAQANAYVAFLATNPPIPTDGLALWFKADAGVKQDTSNNVTSWTDQRNGLVANQNSATAPTFVANGLSGKPGIVFNGSQRLSSTSLTPLDSDFTILIAGSSNDTQSERYMVGIGNLVSSLDVRGFGNGGGNFDLGVDNAYVIGGSFLTQGEDGLAELEYIKSTAIATFYQNGTAEGGGYVPTGKTSPGFNIGDISNGNYPRFWDGTIHEIVVYNRALSVAERDQVEGYLADKYGFYNTNATWPLTYSSEVQAQITANQWNKSQADAYVALEANNPTIFTTGLVAWYKADSGVTQSGGNVSAWTDQTGNYTVTQTGGNQPTYVASDLNGEPALRFNGSQWLYNGATMGAGANNDLTILAVEASAAPGNKQFSFVLGSTSTGGSCRGFGYNGSETLDCYYAGFGGGATPAANSFGTDEMTLDPTRTIGTFYRNGVQTATGTGLGLQDLTPGVTVGAYSNGNAPWQGDIAEVLVYDHQLTDEQLAQADGYLADKYGLSDPNATWPLAYSAAVQEQIEANGWDKAQADAYASFVATNPVVPAPGLQLWLSADVGVTTDGSGNVSQWNDRSPNQFPATQGTSSADPVLVSNASNGKPVLQFSGAQDLQGIGNLQVSAGEGVTIIAMDSTSAPGDQRYLVTAGGVSSEGQTRNMGYEGGLQTLSTTNHDIEGGANAPGTGKFVVDAATLATDGSSVTFYRDGVQTGTGSTGGTGDVYPGFWIGSYVNSSFNWQGNVGEVLIYNRVLTGAEMQQATVYLADKYGLYNPNATWPLAYSSYVQDQIYANQWDKDQADAFAAFLTNDPVIPPTGLAAWFKADTGVTADGSGNVGQWNDQSPNGHNLVQATSTNDPQTSTDAGTGRPTLHFEGSQWLTNSDTITSNSDVTIITVAEPDNTQNFTESVALGSSPSSGGTMRGYGYQNGVPILDLYQNAAQAGSAPPAGQNNISTVTYTGSSGAVAFYSQGIPNGTASVSGSSLIAGLTVGGAGWQGAYWSGNISEVLVYDHVLSAADQEQAEGYLADKYGLYDLDATWPLAYTSAVQAEIVQHQWTKVQADGYVALQTDNPTVPTNGLSLWLRADAGVTAASGQVSAVADQTGNYTLAQNTASAQPTLVTSALNGNPAIQFTGNQSLASSASMGPGMNGAVTIVTVAMTTSPTSEGYSLYLGQGGSDAGANRAIGYADAQLFDISTSYLGGLAPPASQFVAEMVTLDPTRTNLAFYRNGAETEQGTISGVQNLSPGLTMGSAPGLTDGWQGQIAEELVYDHQLSAAEIQQVGAYLAAKYNLPLNGTGPTISPNGGSFTSTQSVTLSAGSYPGSAIHYTMDGTSPTINSPTYSGPIFLSASALVSAATFGSDGTQLSGISSAQFYVNDPESTGDPTAPTSLTVTAVSPTELDLSWQLNGLINYSSIDVYRSSDGGATYQLIAVLNATATSFDDTNAQSGVNYQYIIGTSNSNGVTSSAASSPTQSTAPGALNITITTPSGATPLP
jgi:alpha-tubulin suppressor-like RCC1 family protein